LGPMPVCEDAPCESSCESSKACSRDWDPGGCGHARGTRVSGRSRPRKGCGKRLRQGTCPGLCQSHRVTGKHPAPAPGQRATVGSLGTVREACSSPVQRRPTTAEGYPMTRGAGATIQTSGAKGNHKRPAAPAKAFSAEKGGHSPAVGPGTTSPSHGGTRWSPRGALGPGAVCRTSETPFERHLQSLMPPAASSRAATTPAQP